MWIVLGIIGFLAALITVILLLPVKVIIKNDEQEPLILRYRFLFKTYGEDPDPNNPVIKALKTASGVDRLSKETLQESVRSGGLQKSVAETFSILKNLAKELWQLLKLLELRGKLKPLDLLLLQVLKEGPGLEVVRIRILKVEIPLSSRALKGPLPWFDGSRKWSLCFCYVIALRIARLSLLRVHYLMEHCRGGTHMLNRWE